jgi:exosortase/archaeosortase family protein
VTRNGHISLLKVALVVLSVPAAFYLLERPMRRAETAATLRLLHAFGAGGVHRAAAASLFVFPAHHAPFRVLVTPACSSLASVLALAALGLLAPLRSRRRRSAAVAVALGAIFLGNIARIAGSVAVGLASGSASLVLFHDWVGSTFTFAYTLGGYILMLYLLLPRARRINEPA